MTKWAMAALGFAGAVGIGAFLLGQGAAPIVPLPRGGGAGREAAGGGRGAGGGTPTIVIDGSAPRTPVSPELYGIFFEEISHAGEGGLNAEMVQNRDFEATTIPDGWKVDGRTLTTSFGWKTDVWFTSDVPGWSMVKDGDADGTIALETANPLNAKNPHSLRVSAARIGRRFGVANSGFWGMNVQQDQWYDGSFFARREAGAAPVALTLSLESVDGTKSLAKAEVADIGGKGGEWARYKFSLHATGTDPKARLVIAAGAPGTFWLDCVSLLPRNTFKGHGLRSDLAQMIADLKPSFIRFPGGCIVEGVTLHNRIRWKDSIGDISQRQGDFELWGYYNHYSMGFHEFLQLCEDINAEPLYVVNGGISCQLRRPYELATDTDLHLYVEDTLDALEYAMGPADSKWGAVRAANGHPAPFHIKYVEIGNENWGANYEQHNYRAFYDAIKARYPDVITIADTRIFQQPVEYVDDHYYVPPQRFFELANFYDTADRKGPKIYVGEYAVNRDVGQGNLRGALAEAVFTMNMEKNSDIVRMCSYAPLFENVNKADWPVNLIRFDSSRVIGRSSYYVQKMFSNNRPEVVLKTDVNSGEWKLIATPVKDIYALAGLDQKQNQLVLKIVNSSNSSLRPAVSLKGLPRPAGSAQVETLSNANPTAENTLDDPKVVVPRESETAISGSEFSVECPANSLNVIRIPLQAQ